MAATGSRTRPISFGISYGFLGGPLNARQLKKSLRKAGYVETSLDEADIVIAHSGGTYLHDLNSKPKLILLAAPALTRSNPHELFKKNTRQLWRSAKDEHYLGKRLLWSLYGIYSAFRHPRQNYRMARRAYNMKLELPEFMGAKVVFITNDDDVWPTGSPLEKLLLNRPWSFISLPGAHEHIWVHPEDYIDIINIYAKELLAQANAG